MNVFERASEDEIKELILSSSSKSCDLDPTPRSVLKNCLDILITPITDIINISMETSTFPQKFKEAHVRLLLKKTSLPKNQLNNYRPVSNLSSISKILEKIVANRLQAHIKNNNLILYNRPVGNIILQNRLYWTETPFLVTLTSLVEASAAWWELESWSWEAGISGGGCRSLASCSVRHRDWGCSSWCLSEWRLSLSHSSLKPIYYQIYPEFGHCSSPQCGVWTVHVIPLEMWCSRGGDVLTDVVPRYVLPNIRSRTSFTLYKIYRATLLPRVQLILGVNKSVSLFARFLWRSPFDEFPHKKAWIKLFFYT